MPEILSIAAPIVGGLLGGQGSSQQQQQKQELDPRIQGLLFGDSNGPGLLYDVQRTYQNQMASGGLNPNQTAGLEMQRQTLTDPSFTQGYGAARNLGLGLLGQGVASNPFTSGKTMPGASRAIYGQSASNGQQAFSGGATGASQYTPANFQYSQNPALAGAYSPLGASQAAPAQTTTQTPSADLAEQLRQKQLRELMNGGEFYRGQGA